MRSLPVLLAALLAGSSAAADGLPATRGDWGGAGLLLNPTARLFREGSVGSGLTVVGDLHRHLTVTAVPLPWLELTLRETIYPSFYGLSEPGVDVKVRLLREGAWWPAVAAGGRDVSGSGYPLPGVGRFAGEYIVASRRYWDLDLSLGMGWGRLGGYAHIDNPLGLLGGRYAADRDPADARARGPRAWFSGRDVALFGGAEWHTPLPGLSLKVEYSGDSFRAEQADDPSFVPGLPINAGVAWRPFAGVEIGAGVEQGRRAMLRLSLDLGPADVPPAPAGRPPAVGPRPQPGRAAAADEILAIARLSDLPVRAVAATPTAARLWLDRASVPDVPAARDIGRAARTLADGAPGEIDEVTVVTGAHGLDGLALTLPRDAVQKAADGHGSPDELWHVARVHPASAAGRPPDWEPGWTLGLQTGAEVSLSEHGLAAVHRSYADLDLQAEPLRGFVLAAGLRVNIASDLAYLDTWALPAADPVRSDLPLYAEIPLAVGHAYAAWLHTPADGWHARVAAGHFEEMFGGIGAELLYQPMAARWGIGLEASQVWKRYPGTALAVIAGSGRATGHASVYLEAPGSAEWTSALRLGRYLGGDWGGTVELRRLFRGGLSIGAHVTWTEGPDGGQSRYGGRLEHGLTVTIPIGSPSALPLDGQLTTAFRTLGRDAGQQLLSPLPLHETLAPAGYGRLAGSWPTLLD